MIVAMDLNVSPVPEEDEETFDRHIEEYSAPEHEERVESAVDIARRVSLSNLVWLAYPPTHDNWVYCLHYFCILNSIDQNLASFNSSLVISPFTYCRSELFCSR